MRENTMETYMERTCQRALQKELKILRSLRAELKWWDGTKIYMRSKNGYNVYSRYKQGKEEGIKADDPKLDRILRYELVNQYVKVLEYNCKAMQDMLEGLKKIDLSRVAPILDARKLPHIPYTSEQQAWMRDKSSQNDFMAEDLKYTTSDGLLVRSKSEKAIAERLEAGQIAFRYEIVMNIAGRTIRPDFVIRKDDGKLVIWEHFGLMNDHEYHQRALEKIELYRRAGYRQHDNLICTWEEDIKSAKDIDNIIERFLIF